MERKDELIIALNHAILAHGFAKQSMSALARLINVSRATLYLYFQNKDKIIDAVCARHLQFLKNNTPTDAPLTADGYLQLRLNTLLLLGSRAPIFSGDLATSRPDLADELNSAYAKYNDATTKRFIEMRTIGVINASANCETFVLQDTILVTGTIDRIHTDHLDFEVVAAMLRDYLQTVVQGTLAPHQTVNFTITDAFTDRILTELKETYFYI